MHYLLYIIEFIFLLYLNCFQKVTVFAIANSHWAPTMSIYVNNWNMYYGLSQSYVKKYRNKIFSIQFNST